MIVHLEIQRLEAQHFETPFFAYISATLKNVEGPRIKVARNFIPNNSLIRSHDSEILKIESALSDKPDDGTRQTQFSKCQNHNLVTEKKLFGIKF